MIQHVSIISVYRIPLPQPGPSFDHQPPRITITNDKGRLTEEQIEKMIREAEELGIAQSGGAQVSAEWSDQLFVQLHRVQVSPEDGRTEVKVLPENGRTGGQRTSSGWSWTLRELHGACMDTNADLQPPSPSISFVECLWCVTH